MIQKVNPWEEYKLTGKDIEDACKFYGLTKSELLKIHSVSWSGDGMKWVDRTINFKDIVDFYHSKYITYFMKIAGNNGYPTIASVKLFKTNEQCSEFVNKSGKLIYRMSHGLGYGSAHCYIVYYHDIKVSWLKAKLQFILNKYNFKKETVYKWYGIEIDNTI